MMSVHAGLAPSSGRSTIQKHQADGHTYTHSSSC